MTLAEVKRLAYRDARDSYERIPTLTEVLRFAKAASASAGRTIKVFVELKNFDFYGPLPKELAEKVVQVFKQEQAHSFACVIAFSPLVLYYLRAADPTIETCILYRRAFIASAVNSSLEKVPAWLPHVYPLLDPLLVLLCVYLTPAFVGCTMIGPEANIVSQADMASFARRKLTTYVWVTNTFVECAWFRHFKASFGTDIIFPATYGHVGEPVPIKAKPDPVATSGAAGAVSGAAATLGSPDSASSVSSVSGLPSPVGAGGDVSDSDS